MSWETFKKSGFSAVWMPTLAFTAWFAPTIWSLMAKGNFGGAMLDLLIYVIVEGAEITLAAQYAITAKNEERAKARYFSAAFLYANEAREQRVLMGAFAGKTVGDVMNRKAFDKWVSRKASEIAMKAREGEIA